MIGKKVMFIRSKFRNDDSVEAHIVHVGTVLDKVNVVERLEGRLHKVDKYLVELSEGIIGDFYCDEAKAIVKDGEPIPTKEDIRKNLTGIIIKAK